jgi:hypothetical protein
MSRLLSTLTLLALLLLAAAPASGVMVRGEKTAVPDFFGSSLESAFGDEWPATPYRTRGGVDCSYETALDVRDGPNLYAYVKQNPWTSWDPDGLASRQDYRNEIKQLKEQKSAAMDQAKKSGYSRRQMAGVEFGYNTRIAAAQSAMSKIEKTARTIEKMTRSMTGSVNDESLDDADADYQEFQQWNNVLSLFPAGKDAANRAVHGEYTGAAASVVAEGTLTYLGGKLLSKFGGWAFGRGAAKTPAGMGPGLETRGVRIEGGRKISDTLPPSITDVKNAQGEVFKSVHTPPSAPHYGMKEHVHPNYRNVLPDGSVRSGVSKGADPLSRQDIIDATRPGAQRTGGN